MKTLVINTGSSSIKYQLFNMPEGEVISSGLIEQIGENMGQIHHTVFRNGVPVIHEESAPILNHQAGMTKVAALLTDANTGVIADTNEVELVGHRVVHGGEAFADTIEINDDVLKTIDKLSALAPLHNPSNLIGIRMAKKVFTIAKQIAVFDTAFHQSIPEFAYKYAIPEKLYKEHGIRVYGFHGTSHKYVANEAAKALSKPLNETNLITIHLGNGASITAIRNGQSIDTSLGFTTVGGLVMGTRSGDIDPGVIFYLTEEAGIPISDVKNILYKNSGMKGMTGNNDLRKISEDAKNGNAEAKIALEVYAYRIKKYIGAYMAVIGRVDAIVFTAGVGENSPLIREMSIGGLGQCGIGLDKEANENAKGLSVISGHDSPIKVYVIPTNEELEIANQSYQLTKL
jgi:acetate kinase